MTNPSPWQHHRKAGVADDIEFEIKGQELQFVEIELDPGESAIAEAGAMVWKDASVGINTVFGDGSTSPSPNIFRIDRLRQHVGLADRRLGGSQRDFKECASRPIPACRAGKVGGAPDRCCCARRTASRGSNANISVARWT